MDIVGNVLHKVWDRRPITPYTFIIIKLSSCQVLKKKNLLFRLTFSIIFIFNKLPLNDSVNIEYLV